MRLTRKELMSLLAYDPETGIFTSRYFHPRRAIGSQAGSKNGLGYIMVGAKRERHLAHRLAFLFVTGEWPPNGREVDHINGDRADNRWSNLRLATRGQNMANGVRCWGASGTKGVYQNKKNGRFHAHGSDGRGKKVHLGSFATAEEAAAAYERHASRMYGSFHRKGSP